jgi:hypothetical protein
MKYARIDNGAVVEIVDLDGDPADFFHPTLQFMPAPEGCAAGWKVEGGVLVPPAADLDRLRADKRSAIDAVYAAAVARGLPFGEDDAIQIDPESRQNLAARATRAGFVLSNTPGFTWPEGGMPYRTKSNRWPTFSPAEMVGLSLQVDDLFTAIRVRYAALKGALLAAVTAPEIAAIDETADWPK